MELIDVDATLVFEARIVDDSHSGEYFGAPYTHTEYSLEIDSVYILIVDQNGETSQTIELEDQDVFDYIDESEVFKMLERV